MFHHHKKLNPLFICTAKSEKASLRRAATSVFEVWPEGADCCEPLGLSFGALFLFEERLEFAPVFVTSESIRSAFAPFFCNWASRLSDF